MNDSRAQNLKKREARRLYFEERFHLKEEECSLGTRETRTAASSQHPRKLAALMTMCQKAAQKHVQEQTAKGNQSNMSMKERLANASSQVALGKSPGIIPLPKPDSLENLSSGGGGALELGMGGASTSSDPLSGGGSSGRVSPQNPLGAHHDTGMTPRHDDASNSSMTGTPTARSPRLARGGSTGATGVSFPSSVVVGGRGALMAAGVAGTMLARQRAAKIDEVPELRVFDVAMRHSIELPQKHYEKAPEYDPEPSPNTALAHPAIKKQLKKSNMMGWLEDGKRFQCPTLKESLESYDEHRFYVQTALTEIATEVRQHLDERERKRRAESGDHDPMKVYPMPGVPCDFYFPNPRDDEYQGVGHSQAVFRRLIESRVRQAALNFTFSPLAISSMCGRHEEALLAGAFQVWPSIFHFDVYINSSRLRKNLEKISFGALSSPQIEFLMNYVKSQIPRKTARQLKHRPRVRTDEELAAIHAEFHRQAMLLVAQQQREGAYGDNYQQHQDEFDLDVLSAAPGSPKSPFNAIKQFSKTKSFLEGMMSESQSLRATSDPGGVFSSKFSDINLLSLNQSTNPQQQVKDRLTDSAHQYQQSVAPPSLGEPLHVLATKPHVYSSQEEIEAPVEELVKKAQLDALSEEELQEILERERDWDLPIELVVAAWKELVMANTDMLPALYDSLCRIPGRNALKRASVSATATSGSPAGGGGKRKSALQMKKDRAAASSEELFERAQPVHENDLRVLFDTITINEEDDTSRLAMIEHHIDHYHAALAGCCGISASRARKNLNENRLQSSNNNELGKSQKSNSSAANNTNPLGASVVSLGVSDDGSNVGGKSGVFSNTNSNKLVDNTEADRSTIGYLPQELLEEDEDVINPPWPPVEGAPPVPKGKLLKSPVVIPHGKGIPDPSYFESYAALLEHSPQFARAMTGFVLKHCTKLPAMVEKKPSPGELMTEEDVKDEKKRKLDQLKMLPEGWNRPFNVEKERAELAAMPRFDPEK